MSQPSEEPVWEKDFREFWQDIVCNPDGSLNVEQVKRELSDFHMMMSRATSVYMHVTGGKVSKLNTDAYVVCNLADERYEQINAEENAERDKELEQWRGLRTFLEDIMGGVGWVRPYCNCPNKCLDFVFRKIEDLKIDGEEEKKSSDNPSGKAG